jgi:membrane protein DedA with SNARE-associated domain
VVVHHIVAALHVHHHVRGPRLDYVGVALGAALGWLGIFGPGEAVLIAAGIAASRGRLDIVAVIVSAWIGATAGGVGGWLVGRYGGRRVVLAGRWLRGARARALEHGNRFFERYGLLAVYFAPSWTAGINAMRAERFLPANAVCALVWALLVGLGSYLIGPSIREIAQDIGIFGATSIVAAALAAVFARAWLRRRRARRPRARTQRRDA